LGHVNGSGDDVLERLKDVLVDLERSGSRRLPPERTLTDRLQIPRGTLRERLAAIEALGLIRSTQGSGTYLAEPGAEPNPGFVRLYFELALRLGRVTIEQIEGVRETLERESARLAATARTESDLAGLHAALEALVNAKTVKAGDEADYAFHITLARAAHNPVLLLILDGLSTALREVLHARRAAARRVPGAEQITDATHRPILLAVAAGDAEAATAAMIQHFTIWNEHAAAGAVPKRRKRTT
jgi:GntR family transcriptional regulator, transcriptional repressor for pyruvate dehydrogenase complex